MTSFDKSTRDSFSSYKPMWYSDESTAIVQLMTEGDLDWSALAVFVRSRRAELGLSVKAIAAEAGVSTTWWFQLEAGRRPLRDGTYAAPNVRGEYLGRAAKALGVPLVDLRAVLGSTPG